MTQKRNTTMKRNRPTMLASVMAALANTDGPIGRIVLPLRERRSPELQKRLIEAAAAKRERRRIKRANDYASSEAGRYQ